MPWQYKAADLFARDSASWPRHSFRVDSPNAGGNKCGGDAAFCQSYLTSRFSVQLLIFGTTTVEYQYSKNHGKHNVREEDVTELARCGTTWFKQLWSHLGQSSGDWHQQISIVTVTGSFVLHPLLGDWECITKQSSVCFLVSIGGLEQECFQLATKCSGRVQHILALLAACSISWEKQRSKF